MLHTLNRSARVLLAASFAAAVSVPAFGIGQALPILSISLYAAALGAAAGWLHRY